MPPPLPLAAFALCLGLAQDSPETFDWPRWRGPSDDNVSRETNWSSASAAEPLWRADIGMGYSTPVVAGGRVFTTGYFGYAGTPGAGVDRVTCRDLDTGAPLWEFAYPARVFDNEHGGGTLSTPTVLEGTLFVASRAGELRAFEAATGRLRFTVDLVERHAVDPERYGFASSPRILDDTLYLNVGRTVALDPETGETRWISESGGAAYSTVAPIELPAESGTTSGLVVFGSEGVAVLDPGDGSTLKSTVFRKTPRNVEGATPIVLGSRVFVSSAYDHGGALFEFGTEGPAPELVWRTRRMRTKMAGCTLFDGLLFGFDESLLECLDLDGRVLWRERGLGHGCLSVAGDRLLVTSSKGELIVAEATGEGYRELSRRDVIEQGVFWTPPVLANGRVLVRGSLGELVALDHREGSGSVAEASPSSEIEQESLPDRDELLARYAETSGLQLGPVAERVVFEGRLQVKSLGLADVAARFELHPGGRGFTRFALPPGMPGEIERVFDGHSGWENNPFRGSKLIEGTELDELRSTAGHAGLFDPLPAGLTVTVVGRERFRGVPAVRVDATLPGGAVRSVFFDVATGLWLGRTAEHESTVLVGDWRRVGERLLPFARTVFHPESGEEARWRFEEVSFPAADDTLFEPSEGILELLEAKAKDGAQD